MSNNTVNPNFMTPENPYPMTGPLTNNHPIIDDPIKNNPVIEHIKNHPVVEDLIQHHPVVDHIQHHPVVEHIHHGGENVHLPIFHH